METTSTWRYSSIVSFPLKTISKIAGPFETGFRLLMPRMVLSITALTTLLLSSLDPPRQARIVFRSLSSASKFSPFTSSLSRLDLYNITIQAWKCTIPSVKILTLDKVTLGQEKSTSANQDVCRSFFDSFPSLHSIAFNAVTIPYPLALTRLKVYGIENLYLGPDCYLVRDLVQTTSSATDSDNFLDAIPDVHSDSSDKGTLDQSNAGSFKTARAKQDFAVSPFLRDMSRYFRCRIKHLWLPPTLLSYATAEEILASRPGRPFPPYLAKIEMITYYRPIKKKSFVLKGREMKVAEANLAFEQSGFKNVETREWEEFDVSEDTSQGTMRSWEPISW